MSIRSVVPALVMSIYFSVAACDDADTAQAVYADVLCLQFDVAAQLAGNEFSFSLTTDLPDDTIIMVGVSRLYWLKGDEDRYPIDYYSGSMSAAELRSRITIQIDDGVWQTKLEEVQRIMRSIDEPFQVSRISDHIDFALTVPVNQDNPAFGPRNANLTGPFVSAEDGLRVIRTEKRFRLPFDPP